jgi:hypothetical protein
MFPFSSSAPRSSSPPDAYITRFNEQCKQLGIPPSAAVGAGAFTAGVVAIVAGRKIHSRYFKRIQNSDWVTPDVFQRRKWLKGVATRYVLSVGSLSERVLTLQYSVGDSDNFRFVS